MTSVSVPQWSKGMKLKQHAKTSKFYAKGDRCMQLKQQICLSVGTPVRYRSKFKLLRISAFKSSAQNGESADRKNVSKVPKKSMVLTDGDDSLKKTLKADNVPLSYTSGTISGIAPPPYIDTLFKKWLIMLDTRQEVDGILGWIFWRDTSATPQESHDMKRNGILVAVRFYLLNLDAMIKIPLLMFIPLCLIINAFYGAQVSKELMPLWIFGPFIVAFYVMVLRCLCALSVLSFKQTAYLIKNIPRCYKIACDYAFHVRLSGEAQALIWQPVVSIRNLDYKELSKIKYKFMQEWVVEKYLDFVESVWPYYCRAIRFLKRANFF